MSFAEFLAKNFHRQIAIRICRRTADGRLLPSLANISPTNGGSYYKRLLFFLFEKDHFWCFAPVWRKQKLSTSCWWSEQINLNSTIITQTNEKNLHDRSALPYSKRFSTRLRHPQALISWIGTSLPLIWIRQWLLKQMVLSRVSLMICPLLFKLQLPQMKMQTKTIYRNCLRVSLVIGRNTFIILLQEFSSIIDHSSQETIFFQCWAQG